MERFGGLSSVLDAPTLYRLWQWPFARLKLDPCLRRDELKRARKVLDIGCGPGMNTRYFVGVSYLGIDLNPTYVEYAKKLTGRDFEVADATTYRPNTGEKFDFILMNSMMHHLDDSDVGRVLEHATELLADGGRLHVFDMILPDKPSVARFLAEHDRGDHPRRAEHWRALLSKHVELELFELYPLRRLGVTFWEYFYGMGRRER